MGSSSTARSGGTSSVREANLAVVLRCILRAGAPVSRAELAARTGLPRSTVSRLVEELKAADLVQAEPQVAGRRGRPVLPLVPSPCFVGLGLQVDVGGLAVQVVDLAGRLVAEHHDPFDVAGCSPQETLARADRAALGVLDALDERRVVVGAGLALPGLVERSTGALLVAPNLGWSNVQASRLLPLLEERAGEVVSLNEAELAAVGHTVAAPGQDPAFESFVFLSGEVGIGGAVVAGSVGLRGQHGWAGEIGHVSVDPHGPPCRCGSTGCLEQYAGWHAILDAAGLPHVTDPATLLARVQAQDPAATAAVDRAAWSLGVALAGVLNVLDLPVVLLGGRLGELAGVLAPAVSEHLRHRVLASQWVQPRVLAATSGGRAPAARGAALTALGAVVDAPADWTVRRQVGVLASRPG